MVISTQEEVEKMAEIVCGKGRKLKKKIKLILFYYVSLSMKK